MKKIDSTVRSETIYIAFWVIVLSAVVQAVFLIIEKWDYTVLLGNLLGGCLGVLNFFLMGITIQNAIAKEDEKAAKLTMKLSQGLRSLLLLVIAAAGVVLKYFNTWTVIIPLFFPRIAIMIRPLLDKRKTKEVNNK